MEFLEAKQITEIKESKKLYPPARQKKKQQQQQKQKQKYQPDPRYMVGKLNILKEKQHKTKKKKTKKQKTKTKTTKKNQENLSHLWDLKTK